MRYSELEALIASQKSQLAQRAEEILKTEGTRCPAARTGSYADSGRSFLRCMVEEERRPGKAHFPVADNPHSVLVFCCGSYGECPVWQAEKTDDPVLERVRRADEQGELRAQTERQIACGMRVDDREASEQLEVKRLSEAVTEAAAEFQERQVERHWSKDKRDA